MELDSILRAMPTYLKPSNQKGKEGRAVFDPIGTNAHVHNALGARGWGEPGIDKGSPYAPFGTGLDRAKGSALLEIQFSNYPFCLNNVVRAEVLRREGHTFTGIPIQLLVIVTKARMFPAANSTLYYEQTVGQFEFAMEPMTLHFSEGCAAA
jgi:hypothetical protein